MLLNTAADVEAAYRRAQALWEQGQRAAAEEVCRAVLEARPSHSGALNVVAVCELEGGNSQAAIDLLTRAIAFNPNDAIAHSNLSNALLAQNRLTEALASCERAAALRPTLPQAFYNQGNILSSLGQLQKALGSYQRALDLHPRYLEAHINRGVALANLRRLPEAGSAYDAALAIDPNNAIALGNRASVLLQLGHVERAKEDCNRAIALHPRDPQIALVCGQILRAFRRYDEALRCFDHVMQAHPDHPIAVKERAATLCDLMRYEESAVAYQHCISMQRMQGRDMGHSLHASMQCCDWGSFDATVQSVLKSVRNTERAIDPLPLLSIADDPALHCECARQYVEDYAPEQTRHPTKRRTGNHSRIRVAYISGYFHDQATSRLAVGLFESHDRRLFDITGVSVGPDQRSHMRMRLEKAFDQFIDAREKTDDEIAGLLREREIDIAVGLLGFNRGSRMGVFARRPAPIQVNYLVFPGTLGATYFDYIVADRHVISPADEALYTEKVVYMPDSYQVNDSGRIPATCLLTRDSVGLREDQFVFCNFNVPWKITPAMFDIWSSLLARVPDSVLWLHEGYAPAAVERNLRSEATRRGIAPDRLVFARWMPVDRLYASYMLADLFLDTFPCNAHTTASDALWAGLPVLTCKGHAFASRVAASLLDAIGLPDMITHGLREYESRALELCIDRSELQSIRARLERNRFTHPLFDTATYTRNLETAYLTMWNGHLRGEVPMGFAVSKQVGNPTGRGD